MPFDAKPLLKNLPRRPGVYQMLDDAGETLYVGKARSLKSRVQSYFRASGLDTKTMTLVGKIADIQIIVTESETEALLLEQTLIKKERPPYNIVLRDDKSYPYIHLADDSPFPRLAFYRGSRKVKGRLFGPFPSAHAVRESLSVMQKLFRIRQCEDSVFSNRTRPCLQFQIKRCTALCVGYIDEERYGEDMRHAVMFLEGNNDAVVKDTALLMEQAAERLDFERAAVFRDQIEGLRRVQEQQYVSGEQGNVDVVAAAQQAGVNCVQVMVIRGGRLLGSKIYYPRSNLDETCPEVLTAFVSQYYLTGSREMPSDIIVSEPLQDESLLADALSQAASRKVALSSRVRSQRARWLELARANVNQNLMTQLASQNNMRQRFEALQDALSLDETPSRLECFDVSHSHGEATVASCVVFDGNGPLKSDYRRFNIDGVAAGDDYGAMEQALDRRYKRLSKGEGKVPDLLLIDGGKGQVAVAAEVLKRYMVDGVTLLGVAKGPSRKAGLETLLRSDGSELALPADHLALHLIQHIRDESHRFAISGHRGQRDKARRQSTLEQIPGVGAKRRRDLLRHFGGIRGIVRASREELAKVPGINSKLAQQIYDDLHHD